MIKQMDLPDRPAVKPTPAAVKQTQLPDRRLSSIWRGRHQPVKQTGWWAPAGFASREFCSPNTGERKQGKVASQNFAMLGSQNFALLGNSPSSVPKACWTNPFQFTMPMFQYMKLYVVIWVVTEDCSRGAPGRPVSMQVDIQFTFAPNLTSS